MTVYERMLLTNDGSDLAGSAMRQAAVLARATGSEVLVIRVSHAAGEPPESLTPETWARQLERGGAEEPGVARDEAYPPLNVTAEALREMGVVRTGTLVVEGEPGPSIVRAAERLGCDIIVMSSHGLHGIRRAVLGSVADHVIRNAPGVPVLLCPPLAEGVTPAYNAILVALDGSPLSDALVPHAREIAIRTGASIALLRVVDSVADILALSTPAGYTIPPSITQETAAEVVQAQREAAGEYLSTIAEQLRTAGVTTVTTHVAEGDPGTAIIEAARGSVDLVLLATHGRGGLGRVLLGSVTDYVMRHLTTTPTLIVRPELTA